METDSSPQYEAQQALFEALCRPQMSNLTPERSVSPTVPQQIFSSHLPQGEKEKKRKKKMKSQEEDKEKGPERWKKGKGKRKPSQARGPLPNVKTIVNALNSVLEQRVENLTAASSACTSSKDQKSKLFSDCFKEKIEAKSQLKGLPPPPSRFASDW